jgi:hypothetical protein
MCQGGAVTDNRAELETVLRHVAWLDGEDADIAETIEALAACGDTTLVPALNEALERFLDEGNFYGRDVIAQVEAVVAGVLRGRPDLAGVLPLTGHPAAFSTRWTTSNSSRPAPEATGRARSPACAARPDPADQAWKSSSVSQRV